jgi:hypothetical protein
VTPGIDYEKDKDKKAEAQQYYRGGLAFPQQMEIFGNLIQIHAT